ncbi:uncharacterized protein LOC115625130 [Scaptodrosophila lebanonensis]|uniref:Uncharacterized protein LOC115625130 n=1 Tax=Drosophila lebanonensis TaxID=7225 RepID=A0A6J2TL89_DROLE|nr:uncharacterized protein LOC115625130 [Scaptodrosophila lebanonensis]
MFGAKPKSIYGRHCATIMKSIALILIASCIPAIRDTLAYPHTTDDFIVTLSTFSDESTSASGGSAEEQATDDLIFLAHKSQKQSMVTQRPHQIDLLTSDEEDSLLDQSRESLEQKQKQEVAARGPPVDLRDFVALIPVQEVQAITRNYYRHDEEVQRAYAFLSSSNFAILQQRVVELPEVRAFVQYLNSSGLDVVKLALALQGSMGWTSLSAAAGNEIAVTPSASCIEDVREGAAKDNLHGLHGLVDSVLDVLPMDQVLATFFDKIETDEGFAHLVDCIGTQKFANLLWNLKNSATLRDVIAVLHSYGIDLPRIVESLKVYFFLSSF